MITSPERATLTAADVQALELAYGGPAAAERQAHAATPEAPVAPEIPVQAQVETAETPVVVPENVSTPDAPAEKVKMIGLRSESGEIVHVPKDADQQVEWVTSKYNKGSLDAQQLKKLAPRARQAYEARQKTQDTADARAHVAAAQDGDGAGRVFEALTGKPAPKKPETKPAAKPAEKAKAVKPEAERPKIAPYDRKPEPVTKRNDESLDFLAKSAASRGTVNRTLYDKMARDMGLSPREADAFYSQATGYTAPSPADAADTQPVNRQTIHAAEQAAQPKLAEVDQEKLSELRDKALKAVTLFESENGNPQYEAAIDKMGEDIDAKAAELGLTAAQVEDIYDDAKAQYAANKQAAQARAAAAQTPVQPKPEQTQPKSGELDPDDRRALVVKFKYYQAVARTGTKEQAESVLHEFNHDARAHGLTAEEAIKITQEARAEFGEGLIRESLHLEAQGNFDAANRMHRDGVNELRRAGMNAMQVDAVANRVADELGMSTPRGPQPAGERAKNVFDQLDIDDREDLIAQARFLLRADKNGDTELADEAREILENRSAQLGLTVADQQKLMDTARAETVRDNVRYAERAFVAAMDYSKQHNVPAIDTLEYKEAVRVLKENGYSDAQINGMYSQILDNRIANNRSTTPENEQTAKRPLSEMTQDERNELSYLADLTLEAASKGDKEDADKYGGILQAKANQLGFGQDSIEQAISDAAGARNQRSLNEAFKQAQQELYDAMSEAVDFEEIRTNTTDRNEAFIRAYKIGQQLGMSEKEINAAFDQIKAAKDAAAKAKKKSESPDETAPKPPEAAESKDWLMSDEKVDELMHMLLDNNGAAFKALSLREKRAIQNQILNNLAATEVTEGVTRDQINAAQALLGYMDNRLEKWERKQLLEAMNEELKVRRPATKPRSEDTGESNRKRRKRERQEAADEHDRLMEEGGYEAIVEAAREAEENTSWRNPIQKLRAKRERREAENTLNYEPDTKIETSALPPQVAARVNFVVRQAEGAVNHPAVDNELKQRISAIAEALARDADRYEVGELVDRESFRTGRGGGLVGSLQQLIDEAQFQVNARASRGAQASEAEQQAIYQYIEGMNYRTGSRPWWG